MAQYVGYMPAPADAPGPRTTISAVPPMTTGHPSPSVTNRATTAAYSDSSSSLWTTASRHLKATTAKTIYHGRRYRWELAPAATVGGLNSLGWWLNAEPHASLMAVGAAGLAIGSGFASAHGLKNNHTHLFGAAAGVSAALANVTAAAGFGFGPVSFTVAAITTALGYAVYVPWLIRHRREHHKVTAQAQRVTPLDEAQADAPDDNDTYLPDTAPAMPFHSPFHDKVIPYADDDSDDLNDPIRIGWDEHGNPVLLTTLYRHTLVAGASDFGKSGIVNLIIKKLLRKKHVELFGIDMKPGAPELGPWEPKMRRLAKTPEDARDLLQYVRAECDRRGAFLADLSASSMAAGRGPVRKWIPGVHGPAWWIITDELAELIRQDEELRKQEAEIRKASGESEPAEQEVAVTYESLLAIARFLGIQFVSATQQPSSKVFGGNTDARGNYANRISTRVGEAGHTQFIFGSGCRAKGWRPEELQRPGEFYFGASERSLFDPPKCRAEWVTDEDIAADVGHYFQAAGVREPSVVVSEPRIRLVKDGQQRPARPEPPKMFFPDGTEVRRGSEGWLDLYKVFVDLCAQHGFATKDMLIEHGPYDSRDTARRALDFWLTHGVQVRKVGKTNQFFLPQAAEAEAWSDGQWGDA